MNNFPDLFREILENNNLHKYISEQHIDKFQLLTQHLLLANSSMNLTAITEVTDIIAKHYADSLLIADLISKNSTLIDIGTGAGFPTLPLAIVRPDITITAVDSTAKKIEYISDTLEMLELSNVSLLTARAEIIGHDFYRESFDYVSARAFAPLNKLCEYCLPFLKVGGKCFAMKSSSADTEIDEASSAIAKLGGEMTENISFQLNTEKDIQKRNVIIIQKKRQTPKIYPRKNAQINKNPL